MEDLKLVEKCQAGELKNFSKLYDKYIDKIYKYIYLKTFDKAVAEDLTSDVFYSAMSKIENLDTTQNSSFQSWIYTIASNKVKDYYKTNKQDQTLEDYLEKEIIQDHAKQVDDQTKIQEILKYLGAIKDDQKEIVILRIWDDLSYNEIAQITGKSVDNCKKIVSRTLKSIAANFVLLLILFIIF